MIAYLLEWNVQWVNSYIDLRSLSTLEVSGKTPLANNSWSSIPKSIGLRLIKSFPSLALVLVVVVAVALSLIFATRGSGGSRIFLRRGTWEKSVSKYFRYILFSVCYSLRYVFWVFFCVCSLSLKKRMTKKIKNIWIYIYWIYIYICFNRSKKKNQYIFFLGKGRGGQVPPVPLPGSAPGWSKYFDDHHLLLQTRFFVWAKH